MSDLFLFPVVSIENHFVHVSRGYRNTLESLEKLEKAVDIQSPTGSVLVALLVNPKTVSIKLLKV